MMYTNGTNKRAKGREKTKILSPNEINNAQHKFDSKTFEKNNNNEKHWYEVD